MALVSIDIKAVGADKAAADINKVTQAKEGLVAETSVETSTTTKNSAAMKNEGSIRDLLKDKAKEARMERKLSNFVMRETNELMMVGMVAMSMLGGAEEGASEGTKKFTKSATEGMGAYMGLNMVLQSAGPWGQAAAAAVGLGIAIYGMVAETEAEKKAMNELGVAVLDLNYKLGNISTDQYINKLRQQTDILKNELDERKDKTLQNNADIEAVMVMQGNGVEAMLTKMLASVTGYYSSTKDLKHSDEEASKKTLESELKVYEAQKKETTETLASLAKVSESKKTLTLASATTAAQRYAIESRYSKQQLDDEYNAQMKVLNLNADSGAEKTKLTKEYNDNVEILSNKNRATQISNMIAVRDAVMNMQHEQSAFTLNTEKEIELAHSHTSAQKLEIDHRYEVATLTIDDKLFNVKKDKSKAEVDEHKKMTDAKIADLNKVYNVNLPKAQTADTQTAKDYEYKWNIYVMDTQKRDAELQKQREDAIYYAQQNGKDIVEINKYYDSLAEKNKKKDTQDKTDFSFKYAVYENETQKNKAELDKQRADAVKVATETGQDVNKVNAYFDEIEKQNKIKTIQEVAQQALSMASQVGQTIVDIAAAGHNNNVQILENEKSDKLDAIDAEIEAAGKNAKKKAELEKKRVAVETEMNKKLADEKGAAWEAEKEGKMAMAVINGAVAFTAALPNYILAAIVAASTIAQVGIISGQAKPKFHTGGIIGDAPLAPNERLVIGQVGEAIVTKKQMNELADNGGSQARNLTINFNSPVTETEMVTRAIKNMLYETGQTIDKVFVNTSANRSIN